MASACVNPKRYWEQKQYEIIKRDRYMNMVITKKARGTFQCSIQFSYDLCMLHHTSLIFPLQLCSMKISFSLCFCLFLQSLCSSQTKGGWTEPLTHQYVCPLSLSPVPRLRPSRYWKVLQDGSLFSNQIILLPHSRHPCCPSFSYFDRMQSGRPGALIITLLSHLHCYGTVVTQSNENSSKCSRDAPSEYLKHARANPPMSWMKMGDK